jgi:hypothetical protein
MIQLTDHMKPKKKKDSTKVCMLQYSVGGRQQSLGGRVREGSGREREGGGKMGLFTYGRR